jgi:hypothetical protein
LLTPCVLCTLLRCSALCCVCHVHHCRWCLITLGESPFIQNRCFDIRYFMTVCALALYNNHTRLCMLLRSDSAVCGTTQQCCRNTIVRTCVSTTTHILSHFAHCVVKCVLTCFTLHHMAPHTTADRFGESLRGGGAICFGAKVKHRFICLN